MARHWISRDEIAEIYEARAENLAKQPGSAHNKQIADLLERAQDIRDIEYIKPLEKYRGFLERVGTWGGM